MILHNLGREALINAVTNPGYVFPELREVFLLNQVGAQRINTRCLFADIVPDGIAYAGVVHFGCDEVNLFGEAIGNQRVLGDLDGVYHKIKYSFVLPLERYNDQGQDNKIYGMVLVGGASSDSGGYLLVGGTPVYTSYVSSGNELIFAYQMLQPYVKKVVSGSMKLSLEFTW